MQNVKNTMLIWLLRGLAPHPCLSCGVIGGVLCQRCKSDILDAWIDRCIDCTAPKGCAHAAIGWVSYVFERDGFVSDMLNGYKFKYQQDTAALFSELLAPLVSRDAVLVAIPTIQAHIRQRGFDHNLALVQAIARRTGCSYTRPLIRTNTVVMHHLNKADRATASDNLFICVETLNPTQRYVLVDDVYTTGATLRAARHALRAAGARNIRAVVLARQPLD